MKYLYASNRRVLAIIEPVFIPLCIVDQNLLGTEEGINYFLALLPDNETKRDVKQLFNDCVSSIDKWNTFVEYHKHMINFVRFKLISQNCNNDYTCGVRYILL